MKTWRVGEKKTGTGRSECFCRIPFFHLSVTRPISGTCKKTDKGLVAEHGCLDPSGYGRLPVGTETPTGDTPAQN